ncbi:phosphatase PAP2 family protein [Streptacidiphilus sp. ASG 303]|uniref:phosphatase PAP2 family protein n=1 Tax=Streptacidiphilus sp. ASG 303 TaxID=2896847 RepID=UPI001E4046CF|nr:phosphatase PAP2 family protein [Streptacidiphilus sp. ASG 303]MCD0483324.1 phosphatase PAP2 family protein [Streptacidiphilus sp. ASG 303]
MSSPSAPPAAAGVPRHWWRELLLLALIYAAYDGSRLLVAGSLPRALRNGHALLSAEARLRLSPEHLLNTAFTRHAWLAVPADFAYASLHYLVTPLVLAWLWHRHRGRYRHARTWLGVSTVLGLAGFTLLPTAPPRLLEASYGFTDSMRQHAAVGWWGADASAPKGLGHLTNEFAAMPSLHVGWALWCGVLVWRCADRTAVRIAGLLYPVLIAVVVMGTANHYLLDAVAGCAVMGAGALLAGPALRLADRLRRGAGAGGRGAAAAAGPAPAPAAFVPAPARPGDGAARPRGGAAPGAGADAPPASRPPVPAR